MITEAHAKFYRSVFSLAALYNVAFGLWTILWPQSFFDHLRMPPPNYPGIWRCLGLVVALYGFLYAYAGLKLDRARPIIVVGLAGKILGPVGWLALIHSGEWPVRTFPLILLNDLVWWLPFAFFLVEDLRH